MEQKYVWIVTYEKAVREGSRIQIVFDSEQKAKAFVMHEEGDVLCYKIKSYPVF